MIGAILSASRSITVYVILDIEYPRLGLIRVDVCIGFAGFAREHEVNFVRHSA
jgi:hypothetical protein